MSTHQDAIQRAVVLALAVVGALLDSTLDALVGMTVHSSSLLFFGFGNSMRRRRQSIQELFSNVAFPWLLWYLKGKGFLLEVFLCLSLLRLFYPPILPIWK